MIIYNQAFDLYHCIFRILHLLSKFNEGESIETDRIRIWDFFVLFPEEIHAIRLPKDEAKDIRALRNRFIKKTKNPYEQIIESRKVFEKLKTYQVSALNCLASYGVINKENLALNRVTVESKKILNDYILGIDKPSTKHKNTIALLTTYFYKMSLYGKNGLKNRTNLIESKYDA